MLSKISKFTIKVGLVVLIFPFVLDASLPLHGTLIVPVFFFFLIWYLFSMDVLAPIVIILKCCIKMGFTLITDVLASL